MPNPFRSRPQRPFDPHQFERLRDFLEHNHIDWETYLRSLLSTAALLRRLSTALTFISIGLT
jgi:hypothetical protein